MSPLLEALGALRHAARMLRVDGKIAIIVGTEDWVRLEREVGHNIPSSWAPDHVSMTSNGIFRYMGFYFIDAAVAVPKEPVVPDILKEIARGR